MTSAFDPANVHCRRLAEQLQKEHVVAIIGAGASVAATFGSDGADVASWGGLLRHGVRHCQQVAGTDERWVELQFEMLDRNDLDDWLSVAEQVERRLKRKHEYFAWLRETVGTLKAAHPEVPEAIRNLGVPIVTTNYDSLLDHGTDWKPYTWRQPQAERVFRNETQGIVHLHGHWDDPNSVVLGISSYAEILNEEAAQAIFKAIGTLKTLLFIGCGDGLDDPNFSAFRDWLATTKKDSEFPHYRLALASEVEALQQKHAANERITVIPYGDDYADLPLFLHELAQAAIPDRGILPVVGINASGHSPVVASSTVKPLSAGPAPDAAIDRQLNGYFKSLVERHGWIRFLEIKQGADSSDAPIQNMYVAPQVARQEIPPDQPLESWPSRQAIRDVLREHSKLVLLSDPGAGKSTLVSWLAWQFNREKGKPASDWAADMGDWIPLPLILRELPLKADVTWETLLDAFVATPLGQKLPEPRRGKIEQWLRDGRAWVLIDGLDEVSSLTVRRSLRDAIHAGLSEYPQARWLMTSRIVGYDQVPFDRTAIDEDDSGRRPRSRKPGRDASDLAAELSRTGTPVAELGWLAPFDDDEIAAFAGLWYQQQETQTETIPDRVAELVKAIHSKPDTERLGRIAFLLTMMALIHRRDVNLPDGRAQLYEQIAEAYLDSIDTRRQAESKQTVMAVDGTWSFAMKKSWLAGVAWRMQLRRSAIEDPHSEEANRAILVERSELLGWLAEDMAKLCGDQAEADAERLLDYLTKRSGLLLPRGTTEYAFIHLSMQEYFAACWLLPRLKKSVFARDAAAELPPNEALRDWADSRVWREMFVLLFELLKPEDAEGLNADLFECLFRDRWTLEFKNAPWRNRPTEQSARLASELIVDQHVNLPVDLKCRVRRQLLRWDFEFMQMFGEADRLWNMSPVVFQVCVQEFDGDLTRLWEAAGLSPDEIVGTRFLNLSGCTALSELGPLQKLNSLQTVYLSGCTTLSDLGPLQKLNRLYSLSLSGCTALSDLGPIQKLNRLQSLDLSGLTALSGLGPIQKLNRLRSLFLVGCTALSDLGALQKLKSLYSLSLSGCTALSDLGPIQNVKSLRSLELNGCAALSDLGPLQKLNNLQSLDLRHCTALSDLGPLQKLNSLQFLYLSRCGGRETLPAELQSRNGLIIFG